MTPGHRDACDHDPRHRLLTPRNLDTLFQRLAPDPDGERPRSPEERDDDTLAGCAVGAAGPVFAGEAALDGDGNGFPLARVLSGRFPWVNPWGCVPETWVNNSYSASLARKTDLACQRDDRVSVSSRPWRAARRPRSSRPG